MKILKDKFEVVGTTGEQPVWDPVSKTFLDLKSISLQVAEKLVDSGFPFIQKVEAVDYGDMLKDDLVVAATTKFPDNPGIKGMKKDDLIKLLEE